ncbi:MAG: thiamine biosynthesis protein [Bacteroidetes bacterium 46-16]|nr:MAG: thiamine biosynthesis protein [Bacteroidetes bacterium 46-16]
MMQDMERYSCQLLLPGFGAQAQQLLQQARVLIVGMGGLGCPAAQYLVSSGVGTLGMADYDIISLSNLHRQVLYSEHEVGQKKVRIAAARLKVQNPHVQVVVHDERVDVGNVAALIAAYDIVIDATDNFDTHYLLNDAAVIAAKPLVHGAIYQYEGHVAVWNMLNPDGTRGPNYRDLFPEVNAMQVPSCNDGGVLPTIAGIIGCMQANEAIKIITRQEGILSGRMLVFDAQAMQSRIIKIAARTNTDIKELPRPAAISLLDKGQLKELQGCDDVLLVDVRTPGEHAAFNVGGINIPLQEIEGNIQQLNKGKRLVFYCASGKRSMQAAQHLKESFPMLDVSSLREGISDWD